jgi:hydroxypyruvate reductase
MALSGVLRHTAHMGDDTDWTEERAQTVLRACFDAAVASADPAAALAAHLPAPPRGRCVVVGAGKAAAAMAQAVEAAWPTVPLTGAVVTAYGHVAPTTRIEMLQASHPVPDASSAAAASRMLELVQGLRPEDLVLVLLSGGASSLMALPAPGLTLADKQAVNRALLASGAPIGAMNAVRKHLSAIKGGRLAQEAAPAQVVTLSISDVPGDDPAIIGSGPTVPDPSTFADASAAIETWRVAIPDSVRHHLDAATQETPKPGTLNAAYHLIATPMSALRAAAASSGLPTVILGDALQGEAREMGRVLAGIAQSAALHGLPIAPPCLLLSGGESTVTLTGKGGRGGRNTEFLLSFALELRRAGTGTRKIWAIAADTDGIDGASDAAGALLGPDTLSRMEAAGADPTALLAAHDSYTAFDAAGALLRTGPTRTNVNDFRAILIT